MPQDWRKRLLRQLRDWAQDRFPIPFPVRCYLRPNQCMKENLGTFEFDDEEERGVISVLNTQDRAGIIDTFVEEWAHARTVYLVDTEEQDDPYHHPSFWSEYGRIQQAARERAW